MAAGQILFGFILCALPVLLFLGGLWTGRLHERGHENMAWALGAASLGVGGVALVLVFFGEAPSFARGGGGNEVFDAPYVAVRLPLATLDLKPMAELKNDAEAGDADAQFALAETYLAGSNGAERSAAEAVRWFSRAAERGHEHAMFELAGLLEAGDGVRADAKLAMRWYEEAATQGDVDAQALLGYRYGVGQGVEKNEATSVRWLKLAAEQGDGLSQYYLGRRYELGRGVEASPEHAYVWYSLALMGGDRGAERGRARMESQLNGQQLARAHREIATLVAPAEGG